MSCPFLFLSRTGRLQSLLRVNSSLASRLVNPVEPNFGKEFMLSKTKMLHTISVPRYDMLLSTGRSPEKYRNVSTTPLSTGTSSAVNSISLKWFLAVGMGIGIYLYFEGRSVLKKFPFSQAKCKEVDTPSGRSRYNFIADAVEIASPFVVHIEVSKELNTVFGQLSAKGAGSGFVVGNGEYVLTNAHVVSGAISLDVKLSSGLVVQGEVTDLDQEIDLALVKLNLPSDVSIVPAVFAKSTNIRPGEWVVALGSPFTLSNTITCGVVSTVGRPGKELGLDNGDLEYIQTDAPITVGNSGGPLVNLDGEVIGINVMTAHPGISFAIPVQMAEIFLRNANKKPVGSTKKHSTHYEIGTSLLMLHPRLMRAMRYYYSIPHNVNEGILLASVRENSPAEKAGLRKGDVVVKVNDRNVTSIKDLISVIAKGERFSVEFFRKDSCMKCYVLPKPV